MLRKQRYILVGADYSTNASCRHIIRNLYPEAVLEAQFDEIATLVSYREYDKLSFIISDAEVSDGDCIEMLRTIGVNTPILFIVENDPEYYNLTGFQLIGVLTKPPVLEEIQASFMDFNWETDGLNNHSNIKYHG